MNKSLSSRTLLFLLWPVILLLGLFVYRWSSGEKYGAGKSLYLKHCASCHMDDGSGLRAIIPPLAQADYVQNGGAEMACLIRYGIAGEMMVNGTVFNRPMHGQPEIKEVEIRNIINYIKHAWGNEGEEVSFQEIKEALEACKDQELIPYP